MIYLIFRSSDFYLQGFINNKNYYYFNDATISEITGSTSNNNLGFEGDYNNLMRVASSGGGSQNPQITWEGIQDAFFQLSNMGTSHEQRTPIIASSLIRVIFATAESLRFSQVQNLIINSVNNSGIPGTPVYWNNFIEIIKNWLKWTKEAIAYLLENGSLLNFPRITDILIFHSLISDNFKSCNSKKTRDLNNAGEYCVYLNEKKFYFNDNNENYEYFISYKGKLNNKAILKDFNIGKINPLDNYNNLRFFGENLKTHASWGNYEYDGGNALNYNTWLILLKDPNSKRSKVNNLDDINNIPKIQVQLVNDSNFLASLKIEQEIGFVLYKENDDYHLQIIISQYAETWASGVGGGLWIKLGNGIRLYNN